LQFRAGVLAGLQTSERTVCGCDHPQCPTRRFHLGPRLSPDVRCPSVERTKRATTALGANIFPAHPVSAYDIFSKLPQQRPLLRALLQFDLLGFQTRRDVRNFLQCVRRIMPDAKVLSRAEMHVIRFEKRKIRVGHFPIGIDFDSFENGAKSEAVTQRSQQLRAVFPSVS